MDKNFIIFFQKKFSGKKNVLDPNLGLPEGLGLNQNFQDPIYLGSGLCPIKKLGFKS